VTYANLNNVDLIHAPNKGDGTHYGNDFFKKFLDQKFADDYDIGKSSVYRSQEDIDRDTVKIIDEIKVYNNSGVNKNNQVYREKITSYEDMIKFPPRTTINYDLKGWQKLMNLIDLMKYGVFYNQNLHLSAQASLD
jgi:hypothetical protein